MTTLYALIVALVCATPVAPARASARVYVSVSGTSSVAVIRTSDHTVTTNVPVGGSPHGLAFHPSGDWLYVANRTSNTVSVIQTSADFVSQTIPVGTQPTGVVVSPDGTKAYVANEGSDNLSVIDTASGSVTATIAVPGGPRYLAVTPNGATLYVGERSANALAEVRTADGVIVRTISTISQPEGVTIHPTGVTVYVASPPTNSVAVVRTSDGALVLPFGVGFFPLGVSATPDGATILVTNRNSHTLSLVNAATNSPFATVPVGQNPNGVATTFDSSWAYVANGTSNTVSAVDLAARAVVATVPVGSAPVGVAVSPAALLGLQVGASPNPVAAGEQVQYTLTYSNTGDKPATGLVLTQTLAANTTFVNATGSPVVTPPTVTWNLPPLAPGANGSVTLSAAVAAPLADGTQLVTTADLTDDDGDLASANSTVTVDAAPLLAISETDSPDPVMAGGQLTYTISYANQSGANENASGVVITHTYDPRLSFVNATPLPDPGTTNRWTLGALPVGGSGVITLTTSVASPLPNGTLLTSSVRIDADGGHFATSAASTAVQSAPVLALSSADSADPVAAGALLTYTFTYSNSSSANANATGVVLGAVYPANVTFVSSVPVPDAGMTDRWTIGGLPVGASGEVRATVRVATPLANGTLLQAQATLQDAAGHVANTVQATTVQSAPVLGLSKVASRNPVKSGELLTYTISYGNGSSANAVATGVAVTETYDPGVVFQSATPAPDGGTNDRWTLGTLGVGAAGTIQVTVLVTAPNGSLVHNQAVIQDDAAHSASAVSDTLVDLVPALTIAKSDVPDPVPAGGTLTYTLSYANSGTADAAGIVVSDVLPPLVTFLSATPPADVGMPGQWTIGALAEGASGTITIRGRVASPLADGTIIQNTASIQDGAGHFASAAQSTTVVSSPALSLGAAAAPNPVSAGDTLTYTFTYANSASANQNASGVVLTTTYDPRVTFESSVPAPDAGTTNRWTVGTVAVGASGEVRVTVRVVSPLTNGTLLQTQAVLTDAAAHQAVASPTTTVRSAPALNVGVGGGPIPAPAGAQTTYVLTVSNAPTANGEATNVVVTATYDPNAAFVSATPAPDLGTDNTWSIGTLLVGESRQIELTLQNGTPAGGVTATVADVRDGAGNVASGTLNIPVAQTAPLVLARGNLSYRYEDRHSITIRANFTPPGAVDPTTAPLALIVTTPGVVAYRTIIPPELWIANEPRTRYRYRDLYRDPGATVLGGRGSIRLSTRDGVLWTLTLRVGRLSLPQLSSLAVSVSFAAGSDSYSTTAPYRVSGFKILYP